MKADNNQQESIIEYLLGQARPEESSSLEDRLMTDSDFYNELLIVEDELIDQYLRGELSKSKRESFEDRFLVTPERQRRVRFGRAFNKYVRAVEAPPRKDSVTEDVSAERREVPKPSPKPWYSRFLTGQNPALAYSLVAALVLIVCMASWLALKSWRNTGSHDRGKVLAITLTPGLTRSDGVTPRILIPGEIGTVRLQLALTKNDYPKYQAILLTDEGSKIWAGETLTPELDGKFINVDIPAELLEAGEYQVRLSGQSAANSYEELDRFSFRVIQDPKGGS